MEIKKDTITKCNKCITDENKKFMSYCSPCSDKQIKQLNKFHEFDADVMNGIVVE